MAGNAQSNSASVTPYRVVTVAPNDPKPLTILVYHPQCDEYVERLSEGFEVIECEGDLGVIGDTVEAALCWGGRIEPHIFDQVPNLRWIQTSNIGIDHLVPYLRDQGKTPQLSTMKGMSAGSVAGFALMLMLALQWQLPRLIDNQRAHKWSSETGKPHEQSTCVIVGLGNIGSRVAGHAKHLGMRVLGMRRGLQPDPNVDEMYERDDLIEMLSLADYVVLTAPLTDSTKGMIGRAELAAMKRDAVLINVGRGGVVDEEALAEALTRGDLRGAALDVMEEEPLPETSPLWDVPNLVITPHTASARTDYREAVAKQWMHNIYEYRAGRTPEPSVALTAEY